MTSRNSTGTEHRLPSGNGLGHARIAAQPSATTRQAPPSEGSPELAPVADPELADPGRAGAGEDQVDTPPICPIRAVLGRCCRRGSRGLQVTTCRLREHRPP